MRELHYSYPVDALSIGSSLGNPACWATLDAFSDVKGIWNSADNSYYLGEWTLTLEAGKTFLEPTGTVFRPVSQTTTFSGDELRAEKTFFLPFVPATGRSPVPLFCKSGIMLLRLFNDGEETKTVTCRHRLLFPAVPNDLFTKQPPKEETEKRVSIAEDGNTCLIMTKGRGAQARVFGATARWKSLHANDQSINLEYELTIDGGGGVVDAAFVLAFSEGGTDAANSGYIQCRDGWSLLKQSEEALAEVLGRSEIFTPEPVINRGLQWAKVNTVRVQHQYRNGLAFTNDPPQDIVVIRDLAWYVFGSDYVTPDFSEGVIDFGEKYGYHEDGKLTEFLHADEERPERHDYKLNINDDTPLFVEALYHHAVTCLNDAHLGRVYELMRRAADWILSQISDGLVRCTTDGTGVWGICSWRNIIEGYTLAGAVTEINAECFHALLLTGKVARRIGRIDDADRYTRAAEALRNAINALLISEQTRLYVLNEDSAGVKHHDITGDLIFPVLFEVADEERSDAILETLTDPELWTSWGARTVHPMVQQYDPEAAYQLIGGVWPNLTAWISFALRKHAPDKMVEGMVNIYNPCESSSPAEMGKLVPGEFPERFHGERCESLGMPLSPWTPPTYLWLGVEGLLGVTPNLSGLEMNPHIPASWEWIAVKNLLYRGETLDAFLFGGTLYATRPLTTSFPLQVGTRVICTIKQGNVFAIAMRMEIETLLFVCSDAGGEGTVEIEGRSTVIKKKVALERGGASLIRLGAI